MGFVILLVLYWVSIPILFIIGLVMNLTGKELVKKKQGVRLMIASAILLLIGGGVCGVILASLNFSNMH